MDRSNRLRGFCSFREASTVHSRAKAATSAVSAASFCFFFEERRLNGRMLAVRASCMALPLEDGGDDQLFRPVMRSGAGAGSHPPIQHRWLWLPLAAPVPAK